MIYYIYDGTFEGLLTAIYEAYYNSEKPDYIVPIEDYQQDLFSQGVIIQTNFEKSNRVYQSIEEKISYQSLRNVFYAYLSELKGVGTLIYRYLQLGWKLGPSVNSHLSQDLVKQILQVSQKVATERHRMLGLIRFRKMQNDVYYASIEPDYNIVGLVAPHFAKRLADQNWLIHDLKRGFAAVFNQKEWVITELPASANLLYEENEHMYQQLWKQYYASITIENRKNSKLQRQFMPQRYWKHLIERESI